ncbi:hypothetical protein JTE90_028849 [Oedothorax gibbosus]|uniref:Uncharacterized protein n=1 Tax=Oedothorax gibbosus TaxID=931172 RepID=A0AAV6VZC3_9ARAC|nr:hypothetical protein JTE90_028849 [Oedothorax gibbosus]
MPSPPVSHWVRCSSITDTRAISLEEDTTPEPLSPQRGMERATVLFKLCFAMVARKMSGIRVPTRILENK